MYVCMEACIYISIDIHAYFCIEDFPNVATTTAWESHPNSSNTRTTTTITTTTINTTTTTTSTNLTISIAPPLLVVVLL